MAIKNKKKIKHENQGVTEAIMVAGGQSALARMLGVSQPAVIHWLRRNCPPDQALKIEAVTGVKREKLCPEIFGAHV